MSNSYRIAESSTFVKRITLKENAKRYGKIRRIIYPVLRRNPYQGPNIKRLKENFAGILRYRIGDFRLFYTVSEKDKTVFILDFRRRKDIYR